MAQSYSTEDVGSIVLGVMHHWPQSRLQVQIRHRDTEVIQRQGQSLPSRKLSNHSDLVAFQRSDNFPSTVGSFPICGPQAVPAARGND